MTRIIRTIALGLLAGVASYFAAPALADTIVLKDGTFVEGKIVNETSKTIRVESVHGERTYERKNIEQIIPTVDFSVVDSIREFEKLPPAMKAALNARADYALKRYERALKRIEPFAEYSENAAVRSQLDWIFIECQERLGHWETAKEKLEIKKEKGSPQEKLRAKAHLDIFKWNPDYDLRFIGTTHARNFLVISDAVLRDKSREPNSLMDVEIMQAALEEYCEQMLRDEGFSVPALEKIMDQRKTVEAALEMKGGDVEKQLPYYDMLKKAEKSIANAQAVLPGYGSIYELQLTRVEAAHFLDVWYPLFIRMLEVSPEPMSPAFDPTTGRLTREGRLQLIAQCDEFIARGKLAMRMLNYIQEKVARYPRKLKTMGDLNSIAVEYCENMIKWATNLKEKSNA